MDYDRDQTTEEAIERGDIYFCEKCKGWHLSDEMEALLNAATVLYEINPN